jgi:hypothetical protein
MDKQVNISGFVARYWPQLIFIVIAFLGYYQIAFFQTTFKFDAIYNHLTWRHLIVDNIRHFHLPLWNYYHHMGVPIHADPQSGAWYPVVWIYSLFGTYDLYSYNTEFMLHIFIAGLGMQYLLGTFSFSKHTQLLISISYVFSGFFASNSMFLTWVISAAWIPFVFARFKILLATPNMRNSIVLACFIFLLISGGYPSFAIVLSYVLVFFSLGALLITWKQSPSKAKKQLTYLFLTLFVSLLLSSVILVSVFQVIPYMTRGEALMLSEASIPPFLPKHLLSLILPYSFAELEYDQTVLFDGSNIYFGLLVLLSLILALIKIQSWKTAYIAIGGFSLVFILLSLGLKGPFYSTAFQTLPGFNFFRFPTFFRYFALLGFLMLSAHGLELFWKRKEVNILKISSLIIVIVLVVYFIIAAQQTIVFNWSSYSSMYDFVTSFGFWDKVFFQSLFQLVVLVLIIILISRFNSHNYFKHALLVVLSFEMIVAFNIYMPYTITSYKADFVESNNILHKQGSDFTLEANHNILDNCQHMDSLYLFSHFNYIFQKRVGDKGNTFKLKEYKKLFYQKPLFYQAINHPLFYLEQESNTQSKGLISLAAFDYNSIEILVNNPKDQNLIFLQNYYPGWQLYVNNKQVAIDKQDNTFMKIDLPKGKSDVIFTFNPIGIKFTFWLSITSLFIALLYLIVSSDKKSNPIIRK